MHAYILNGLIVLHIHSLVTHFVWVLRVLCPCDFQEGRTALHIQAAKGNTSMLKFLIAQFNPDLEAISQVGGLQCM